MTFVVKWSKDNDDDDRYDSDAEEVDYDWLDKWGKRAVAIGATVFGVGVLVGYLIGSIWW